MLVGDTEKFGTGKWRSGGCLVTRRQGSAGHTGGAPHTALASDLVTAGEAEGLIL